MKIAIPIIDTNKNRHILANGLNANGSLCIYDYENKTSEYIKTLDLALNLGDLLPSLESKGILTVLTKQIHPMALKVLVNKGFKVYQAIDGDTDDNIKGFLEQRLGLFTYDEAMEFATVCSGACTTCDTSTCEDKKYIDS